MNVEADVVGHGGVTLLIRVTVVGGISVGFRIVLQIDAEHRPARRHVAVLEICPAGVCILGWRHLRKSFDFHTIVGDGASRVRILPSQIEMIDLRLIVISWVCIYWHGSHIGVGGPRPNVSNEGIVIGGVIVLVSNVIIQEII